MFEHHINIQKPHCYYGGFEAHEMHPALFARGKWLSSYRDNVISFWAANPDRSRIGFSDVVEVRNIKLAGRFIDPNEPEPHGYHAGLFGICRGLIDANEEFWQYQAKGARDLMYHDWDMSSYLENVMYRKIRDNCPKQIHTENRAYYLPKELDAPGWFIVPVAVTRYANEVNGITVNCSEITQTQRLDMPKTPRYKRVRVINQPQVIEEYSDDPFF